MSSKQKLKRWFSGIGCAFGTALLITSLVFGTTGPLPSYHQGYARSAGESAYPGLWKGLVGAWVPALGPTGTTLRDVSGYQNHGTLTNMEPATDWVINAMQWSLAGYVLEYDGSTEWVTIADHSVLDVAGANESFSLIVRYRQLETTGSTEAIMQKGSGTTSRPIQLFEHSATFTRFQLYDGTNNPRVDSSGASDDNTQRHIIAVRDVAAAQMRLYRNGVDDSTSPNNVSFDVDFNDDGALHIGAQAALGMSSSFEGAIGEAYLYNRVITPAEVLVSYYHFLAPFILRLQLFVKAPVAVGVVPCFRLLMGVGC